MRLNEINEKMNEIKHADELQSFETLREYQKSNGKWALTLFKWAFLKL